MMTYSDDRLTAERCDTVLVVNDDPASRYAVAEMLRKRHVRVVEAATGTEALRLADGVLDLIILDLQLPDVMGFQVCQQLKEQETTCSIPVLMLTAKYVDEQDEIEGLRGGADGYLSQPVSLPKLWATVESLLRLRRAERSLRHQLALQETMTRSMPVAIFYLDLEGQVVYANPAGADLFKFGHGISGNAGQEGEASKIDSGMSFAEGGGQLANSIRGHLDSEGHDVLKERSGMEIPIKWWLSVIRSEDRQTGMLLTITDERQVLRAQAAQRELASQLGRIQELERRLAVQESNAGSVVSPEFQERIRQSQPDLYRQYVCRFVDLLRSALNDQWYRSREARPRLHLFARDLAALKVGPRDLIDLHGSAIEQLAETSTSRQQVAIVEEGRLVLLELMGNLLALYRERMSAFDRVDHVPTRPSPSAPA